MSEVLTRLAPALGDHYRIEREVGSGAMATVYLAHDLKHDREVALKVLRPEIVAVLGVERFLNEIKIAARLDHPHILTLIDSGSADGFLYYVLPFVRGESLRTRLRREKQLSLEDALAITKQVGSALEYAHRQGVIHRDIKPENILIHEGEAMLADFGIALAVKEAAGERLTESGRSLGTPQYMSPEQATGDRTLDARSDEYSLAAVLYEMLAGEPPHTGPNVQAIIAKLLTERPIRLRVLRNTVPEGIEAAVAKALATVPADRYSNAGDFARALGTYETPAHERPQSRRWIALAAGATAIAAAVTVALVFARGKPPRPLAPPLDRVQLTSTGNAIYPSMSPDGSHLAFGEKQCDAKGDCTYRLVIQEVDGTGRLVLTDNVSGLGGTQWTSDGRFVVYFGSYGSELWGMFAISTLGGEHRFLGCCMGRLLSGDTALVYRPLSAGDTVGRVRLVSARGGQPLDSIPIHEPGVRFDVIPTTYKDRLLILVRNPGQKPRELRLINFNGDIIDRSTAGFDLGDRSVSAKWLTGRGELLVAVQHEPDGDEYDFLRIRADASHIAPDVDTVAERIGLGEPYDIAPDGGRLVYASGPVEMSIWADTLIWFTPRPANLLPPTNVRALASPSKPSLQTPLSTSTTVASALISPDGTRLLVRRQVLTNGLRRAQLFITPFMSWEASPVSAPLDGLVAARWTPDGNRIVYANRVGSRTRVMEVDAAGRNGREVASTERMMKNGLFALRDGGVALIGPDGRSIALKGRPGLPDKTFPAPGWLGPINGVSQAPAGDFLGILSWDRAIDSAVVTRFDANTGTFKRMVTLPAENLGFPTWLNDGNLVFDLAEVRGTQGLYLLSSRGAVVRLGALPRGPAEYSVSSDGRHVVATTSSDKYDVYMIRNFGDFLTR